VCERVCTGAARLRQRHPAPFARSHPRSVMRITTRVDGPTVNNHASSDKRRGMVELTAEESNLLFQVLEEWEHHLAHIDLDGLERDHDETDL